MFQINTRKAPRKTDNSGLTMVPIGAIPESAYRRGPTNSECRRAVTMARSIESGAVEITGEKAAVDRFYKATLQWRSRHPEIPLRVRKASGAVYLWAEGKVEELSVCRTCGQLVPRDDPA